MLKRLSAVVLFTCTLGHAVEPIPAATPGPDSKQIGVWVKQLGSEEYTERQAAMDHLKSSGEAAVAPLEKAAETADDPEVRARATALLPYVRGAMTCRIWKQAMQERWIAGLKEGTLSGPIFGAHTLSHDVLEKLNSRNSSTGMPIRPNPGGEARDAAMEWICRTQRPGGQWDSFAYGAEFSADVEQTSMALIAFLGAGHNEKNGLYKENVQKAVAWLSARQRADGAILNPGWSEVDGLTHAIAGMALATAAGQGRLPDTIAAAQKAVEYSLLHQTKTAVAHSGYGRQAKSATPDLFTSAFFTMQLKSAKIAGLRVDPMAFDGLIRFLDSVDAKNPNEGGFFSYVPGGKATPEATLAGCVGRFYLGKRSEELSSQANAALKAHGDPTTGKESSDLLSNYLAMLVAFQQSDEIGTKLNHSLKRGIIPAHILGGDADGSWHPGGKWSGAGRVFATAMNALCLEVYYRYLPLYKE